MSRAFPPLPAKTYYEKRTDPSIIRSRIKHLNIFISDVASFCFSKISDTTKTKAQARGLVAEFLEIDSNDSKIQLNTCFEVKEIQENDNEILGDSIVSNDEISLNKKQRRHTNYWRIFVAVVAIIAGFICAQLFN